RPSGNTICNGVANSDQPALGAGGFAVTITSGSTEQNNNFGNFQQGTKSGVKFNDLNGDGTKDAGEPGLPGWDIPAYTDTTGNGVRDNGETTFALSTTDGSGAYSFSLNPGKSVFCEVLYATLSRSRPSGNTICNGVANTDQPALAAAGFAVTITSGSTERSEECGVVQQGRKSGVKFNDMNANGARDLPEDVGLPGWDSRAYTDSNGNGVRDNGETTFTLSTTDGSGAYSFSLNPGKYVVCEVLQATWTQSRPSGNTICNGVANTDQPALAAAGFAVTITSGSTEQ